MPNRPTEKVARKLDKLLPGGEKCWNAMVPGFIGAGDTFRGACFFAFADDDSVEYALHVPIDVDFGQPRDNDVQNNVKELVGPILEASDKKHPDLIIGDYYPMIYDRDNGTSIQSPFKAQLEEHVREQLDYYFPDNIVKRLGIMRPRSEFFMISRKLFEQVTDERRFWPWDPMPEILIYAQKKGLMVEKIDIGNFYEMTPKFASVSIRDQVWRTAFQISSEWLRWEHGTRLKPEDVCGRLFKWKEKIFGGTDLAFKALEKMLNDPNVR